MFRTEVCSICGKEFIKPAENLYKVIFAGRTFQCCSYHCYQKALAIKESNNSSEYSRYMSEYRKNSNEEMK